MYNKIVDKEGGKISIYDNYNLILDEGLEGSTPYLRNINDEYIISINNLENVLNFHTFYYDSLGRNIERYTDQYYRISKNGTSWSNWLPLSVNIDNFPKINPNDNLNIEIKWVRVGTSNIGSIRIVEFKLDGDLKRSESLLDGENSSINVGINEKKILTSPFIFKVFKINDIEIIPNNLNLNEVEIKYRYSQDNSRTWSNWEFFTKENITTLRVNPIRFFQIEYSIENKSKSPIKINDINIIGDFQNVNKDYQKSNLFGVRECCQSNIWGYYDSEGNYHPNTTLNSAMGDTCETSSLPQMTNEEKANLYNPYSQNTAAKLLEKLSADSEMIFGHKVNYFVTDADKSGQDHTLNEYQLYNVVCQGDLKVAIEGNNFPDSQIKMNVFDLDLFDTMEAHITKKQFKEIFGPSRRPSKEDIIYFCQVNRMYQVEHAQQFRGFNNTAIYYKLVLKKYNKKANVKADTVEIKNQLENLTKNTTIEDLFNVEKQEDKKAIANKPMQTTLTSDPIRLEYLAEIDKELIENSTNIISKSNYDLSSVDQGEVAVKYRNYSTTLKISDNFAFQIWFNIHNYMKDEVYSFIDIWDSDNSIGWKTYLTNDKLIVNMNSNTYEYSISDYDMIGDPTGLLEETWYCYLLNVNQRDRKMEQYIYKRNIEDEEDASMLPSNELKKIYYKKTDIVPVSYIIDNENIVPKIIGSDMKVTNIRLFSDVIPEKVQSKLLNQYIVGNDYKYLIFGDNANTRIYLNKYPLG